MTLAQRELDNDPEKDGGWTVQKGKPLNFRYRIFIRHGDYKQANVAEAYLDYANHDR